MRTPEHITKVLSGRKFGTNARDIARECGVSTEFGLKEIKRILTKMVKDGTLESKVVKASHRVNIQGKFGGAAMGTHRETRYTLAQEPMSTISVDYATTELVSIGPAHLDFKG